MAEILIGTSGYDYPEWRGVLYPHELKREEFLTFYAEHFNALEINYTYYGMPEERQMSSMAKRTGGRVRFSVKAHRSLTHEVSVSTWRDAAKEFRAALLPLENKGLLLSVLLQFPQSFHYAVDERRYLDGLVAELSGLPLVAEFRHASWQNPRVYDGLKKRNVGWCICDLPALKNLPSAAPVVTSTQAYLRFHGRNADSWHGTNARDRYEYLYTDAELESFVPRVSAAAQSAQLVQIYFNNHAKGHAVVNAQRMKILADRIG